MIVIGLTGSIGMGKSTTAKALKELGIPVFDSDRCVHELLDQDQEVIAAIQKYFPAVVRRRVIDRKSLGEEVFDKPELLVTLEQILHPKVRSATKAFIARHREAGAECVVLDIPLLYETRGEDLCDVVFVVSAPPDIQRERVLSRPGMNPQKFSAILSKQLPDKEKRERADFIIRTDSLESTRRDLGAALAALRRDTR